MATRGSQEANPSPNAGARRESEQSAGSVLDNALLLDVQRSLHHIQVRPQSWERSCVSW
jgi:hypothetical protein